MAEKAEEEEENRKETNSNNNDDHKTFLQEVTFNKMDFGFLSRAKGSCARARAQVCKASKQSIKPLHSITKSMTGITNVRRSFMKMSRIIFLISEEKTKFVMCLVDIVFQLGTSH